jgi:molybdenum cofactor biosynthesis enzyme
MTTQQAAEMILNAGNKIFTVQFIKRTNNELRTMNCRLDVTKHLKGGEPAYDPKQHHLIWVYDMQKKAYRSISIEGIRSVTMNGEKHEVILPNV